MLVNNKHGKIIGAGSFTLLPGETGDLPKGYDRNHPVIAFYFDKGYLVEVELENAIADEKAKAKAEAETKLREALAGMSLEELQAEAKELGIKTTNKDTADTLIQKIAEKSRTE